MIAHQRYQSRQRQAKTNASSDRAVHTLHDTVNISSICISTGQRAHILTSKHSSKSTGGASPFLAISFILNMLSLLLWIQERVKINTDFLTH